MSSSPSAESSEAVLDTIAGMLLHPPQELAVEHARLFGGLRHGFGLEPPYESVWRGEHRVMGQATQAVAAAYAQAGAALADPRIPADHVGFELTFLAHLLGSSDPRAEGWLRAFLDEHVLAWVPEWCRAVGAADPGGAYGQLAAILLPFVEEVADAVATAAPRG